MSLDYNSFKILCETHNRFVLTTHVNPDGDGLGCEVALARLLTSLGKQVTILNYNQTPENYLFLEALYPIIQFDASQHAEIIENAEVIILLDANSPKRVVDMEPYIRKSSAKKVCIDHHLEPGDFADLYLLDEQSTATGEILYNFICSLSEKYIDHEIATALYTAIMTDTGSFRYQKTDSETHTIIAHLLQAGADPVEIFNQVYEQASVDRMRLLGLALANMRTMYDGRLAYMTLTRIMFESTGTSEAETDAFVPYTLALKGVQIGIMFSELDGMIKVNFRSKGDIRINELAKEFGGNGHINAAGARILQADLEETVKKVIQSAGAFVR